MLDDLHTFEEATCFVFCRPGYCGVLLEYQGELKAAFAECDPSGTGKVSVKDWDALLRRVTQLQLPWIKLKDHFVEDNVGSVDFLLPCIQQAFSRNHFFDGVDAQLRAALPPPPQG